MSQNKPHSNGHLLHYISKSTEEFNVCHDPPGYDVANLLELIDSVVDCRDDERHTNRIFANASLSNIPSVTRNRSRSSSTILSSNTCKKLKARRPPPRITRRRCATHTAAANGLCLPPSPTSGESQSSRSQSSGDSHPMIGNQQSPRSYSSVLDYKDSMREEQKYPTHASTPDVPKMSGRLSAILSVGVMEDDANENIDYEYDVAATAERESDTNRVTDPRTKHECKRIMFLYNSKSGGQKATKLLPYFRAYTSLIYDLLALNSSTQELHKLAQDLSRYENRLVVCIVGGDGSQCWATSLVDKALQTVSQPLCYPTVVPFPVGTGNDLSRSLGWGNMERTPDKIIKHIADVFYCYNVSKRFSVLDRWSIDYKFERNEQENIDPQCLSPTNQTSDNEEMIMQFSPPLPTRFMCYLSFGYDAMITYNFARERKMFPQRFKSQLTNQAVYLMFGLKELVRPSAPVNDSILLEVDGKKVDLPKDTRSLKLVNINSAANGVFFWGYLKSNKDELQTWKRPQLNDGLIEIMATRGSADLASFAMRMGHAHRLGQSNDVKLRVVKTPVYLQIDGEGWCIEDPCTLHIQLHDQLPTLIGYKFPRGVYHKYEAAYYTDEEKEARHRYRDVVRMKYNIPKKINSTSSRKEALEKQTSIDDFDLELNANRDDDDGKKAIEEEEEEEGEKRNHSENAIIMNAEESSITKKAKNKKHYRSMSELHGIKRAKLKKKKQKVWKPLFANKNSWKRNLSDANDAKNVDKKPRKVKKWF